MPEEDNSEGIIVERNGKYTFFRDTGDGYPRTVSGYTAAEIVEAIRKRDDRPLHKGCGNTPLSVVDAAAWAALQHDALNTVRPVDMAELWQKVNMIYINTVGGMNIR